MPIHRGNDTKGSYYQYDNKTKYYYAVGDAKSRMEAKKLAMKSHERAMSKKWSKKGSKKGSKNAGSNKSSRKVGSRKGSRKGSKKAGSRKGSKKGSVKKAGSRKSSRSRSSTRVSPRGSRAKMVQEVKKMIKSINSKPDKRVGVSRSRKAQREYESSRSRSSKLSAKRSVASRKKMLQKINKLIKEINAHPDTLQTPSKAAGTRNKLWLWESNEGKFVLVPCLKKCKDL
jgi:Txe/YoeB family toxin of Txe-Axe toxin-antitoxin module